MQRPATGPEWAWQEESEIGINIGRGYGMRVYTCPTSADHPQVEYTQ